MSLEEVEDPPPYPFEETESLSEDEGDNPYLHLHEGQYDNELDFQAEIERLKAASSQKFRSKWEEILSRYAAMDDATQSDEIDLATGEIITDNGHLRLLATTDSVVGEVVVGDIWSEHWQRLDTNQRNKQLRERRKKQELKTKLKSLEKFYHKSPQKLHIPPVGIHAPAPLDNLLLNPSPTKRFLLSPIRLDTLFGSKENSPFKSQREKEPYLQSPSKTSPLKEHDSKVLYFDMPKKTLHNAQPQGKRSSLELQQNSQENSHQNLQENSHQNSQENSHQNLQEDSQLFSSLRVLTPELPYHISPLKRERLDIESESTDVSPLKRKPSARKANPLRAFTNEDFKIINDEPRKALINEQLRNASDSLDESSADAASFENCSLDFPNSVSKSAGRPDASSRSVDFEEEYTIVDDLSVLGIHLHSTNIYNCAFHSCRYCTGNKSMYQQHLLGRHRQELITLGYPIEEKSHSISFNSESLGVDIKQLQRVFPLQFELPPPPVPCGLRVNGQPCRKLFSTKTQAQIHHFKRSCSTKIPVLVCPVLGCGYMTDCGYEEWKAHMISAGHIYEPDYEHMSVSELFSDSEAEKENSMRDSIPNLTPTLNKTVQVTPRSKDQKLVVAKHTISKEISDNLQSDLYLYPRNNAPYSHPLKIPLDQKELLQSPNSTSTPKNNRIMRIIDQNQMHQNQEEEPLYEVDTKGYESIEELFS